MKTQRKYEYPDWVMKYKRKGVEIRCFKGKYYYVYEYKTVYDKDKKGPKKKTGKMIGKITKEEGFIPSEKEELRKKAQKGEIRGVSTKEYGFSAFLSGHLRIFTEAIKEVFGERWKEVVAMAYCRLMHYSAIKNMPLHIENSWISEEIGLRKLTDKQISESLRELGKNRDLLVRYMRFFTKDVEYILTDITNIFNKSQNMIINKKGYNSKQVYTPQVNLLYTYSLNNHLPIYYRIIPGNIRDVKAFKNAIIESGIQNAIVITDKGFYSEENLKIMETEQISYIIPLKRDNKLIEYRTIKDNKFKNDNNYFEFEKRFIWYEEKNISKSNNRLILYLDEQLRVKEEGDYLHCINTHPEEYTLKEFHHIKHKMGTIALLTNLEKISAEKVFQLYKSRVYIEQMFDSMKNVLEMDRTYMQNEHSLEGWMFINFIALQWYQFIYKLLLEKNLLNKYSVSDFLLLLREIRKVKINDNWYVAELTQNMKKFYDKINIALF